MDAKIPSVGRNGAKPIPPKPMDQLLLSWITASASRQSSTALKLARASEKLTICSPLVQLLVHEIRCSGLVWRGNSKGLFCCHDHNLSCRPATVHS